MHVQHSGQILLGCRAWLIVCLLGHIPLAAGATPKAGAPSSGAEFPATYQTSFFFCSNSTASVTPPEVCLGFPLGARMARPEQIVACFKKWAQESPRVRVEHAGKTYEGRELIRVVIATEDNHRKMTNILEDIRHLADPRGRSSQQLTSIIERSPAIGWFGYSIHGDETSGADASLAFGYLLAAGTHASVNELLAKTVVVIDPVMNPDGRTRIINQVRQADGAMSSLNFRGFHRGHWPWGRGNHYLFDMNRDWIVGSQPETRSRWQGLLKYHPQLMVDAHEMGPNDTYLFYPRAEPINPELGPTLRKWTRVFGQDLGAAFDAYKWPYYTREWADGWYPGYSDAWGSLLGAIGILYEQAKVWGRPLRTTSGQVVTYGETVHHQAVASLANLTSLAKHRKAILQDYLAFHQRALQNPAMTLAVDPTHYPDRTAELITALLRQGVEVWQADQSFTVKTAAFTQGTRTNTSFGKGTYLIDMVQPRGALVRTLLAFDPRFSKAVLQEEREKLEQTGRSGIYDITTWNLPMSFGLEAAWIASPVVARTQVDSLPNVPASLEEGAAVGWVVSGAYDRSIPFAAAAVRAGVRVRIADASFTLGTTSYPEGSLLIRVVDNPSGTPDTLAKLAKRFGVPVVRATTALSPDEGPDLGGQHFHLLYEPKVAILANAPTLPSDYGHVWYHIDHELRVPASLVDTAQFGRVDLRKYNVLVLPPIFSRAQLLPFAKKIRNWVENGGTLVAMGSSVDHIVQKPFQLSRVELRRNSLSKLQLYQRVAERWFEAQQVRVDPAAVWNVSADRS